MTGWKSMAVAVIAAVGSIIGFLTGIIDGTTFSQAMWALVMAIFLRIGIDLNVGGWFAGYKTYATAIIGMLGYVTAYLTGEITLIVLIQSIVTGLLGLFLRSAVKKSVTGPGNE